MHVKHVLNTSRLRLDTKYLDSRPYIIRSSQ